jgi:DNA-binding response OmpR family regulator
VHNRSLDVHIARLRSKLGVAGRQIETVIGVGYRFIADVDPSAVQSLRQD